MTDVLVSVFLELRILEVSIFWLLAFAFNGLNVVVRNENDEDTMKACQLMKVGRSDSQRVAVA